MEAFEAALNDDKLQLEVIKQEPRNEEAALVTPLNWRCLSSGWPARVLWLTKMTAIPSIGRRLFVPLQSSQM